MEITISKSGSVEIVELSGRIDATNSGELEKALTKSIEGGASKLLIDLENLEYISSSGLRVFLLIAKMLEKKGKIALCKMQSQVEQIFTISGFNTIFPIFAHREDAVSNLNKVS
ncbi:MAG: STAS domain-containing protein [Bacteroidales bacterium]